MEKKSLFEVKIIATKNVVAAAAAVERVVDVAMLVEIITTTKTTVQMKKQTIMWLEAVA